METKSSWPSWFIQHMINKSQNGGGGGEGQRNEGFPIRPITEMTAL